MTTNQSDSPSKQQMKLIKYLDDFDKQINHRKTSGALEQQLASLSNAYNQAQQKLLQTEKALMSESILLEKQRSVIDIYKYALNQELDEHGILYFLQKLQEDETNRDIYEDIGLIRSIINRKKIKNAKKMSEEQKASKDLRKQVERLAECKQMMSEEKEETSRAMQQLRAKSDNLESRLMFIKEQLDIKRKKQEETLHLLQEQRGRNEKLRKEIISANNIIDELRIKQTQLIQLKRKSSQIQFILKNKLGFSWIDQQQNSPDNLRGEFKEIAGLEKKIDQLLKYKLQYKRTKLNSEENDFFKKQINLLKLYLSEEAFQLFKQFQQQKLDCIETEIRNLAVLEKSRLLKLSECEKDVWKYRIQLMKQQGFNSKQSTQTNNRLSSSVIEGGDKQSKVSQFDG